MKRALVTLAIGDRFIADFKRFCHEGWKAYAGNHGLDLIVFDTPLDDSPRARSRSPAWQKCLVLSHPSVRGYQQIAWVDADILINPRSPDIFDSVPPELVGAVDAYATPTAEDHRMGLERLYEHWSANGIEFIDNLSATDFHARYGLEGEFDSVVQTGVMVLSSRFHRELFEHIYNAYEDRGEAYWNYEMRPMSYELLRRKLAHWLSPRFNMIWSNTKMFQYPFFDTSDSWIRKAMIRVSRRRLTAPRSIRTRCATTAFLNNYFLHFAGCPQDMVWVDQRASSIFEI